MKLNEINNTPERQFAIKWMNDWKFEGTFSVDEDGTIHIPQSSFELKPGMIGDDCKLPVKFGKIGGSFRAWRNKLVSLEGFPTEVGQNLFIAGANLSNLFGITRKIGGSLEIDDSSVISFVGISDMIDFVGNKIIFNTLPVTEGGIGMLLINGVRVCDGFPFNTGFSIIENYAGRPQDFYECQAELIENGFEYLAKL